MAEKGENRTEWNRMEGVEWRKGLEATVRG